MKTALLTALVFLVLGTLGFFGYWQVESQRKAAGEAELAAERARLEESQQATLLARDREAEALRLAAEREFRAQAETARELAAERERLLQEQATREAAEREIELARLRREESARRQAELEAELEAQRRRLAAIHQQQNTEVEEKLQAALASLRTETQARTLAEREAEERRIRLANALERQRLWESQHLQQVVLADEQEEIRRTPGSAARPNDYRRRHLRLNDMLSRPPKAEDSN